MNTIRSNKSVGITLSDEEATDLLMACKERALSDRTNVSERTKRKGRSVKSSPAKRRKTNGEESVVRKPQNLNSRSVRSAKNKALKTCKEHFERAIASARQKSWTMVTESMTLAMDAMNGIKGEHVFKAGQLCELSEILRDAMETEEFAPSKENLRLCVEKFSKRGLWELNSLKGVEDDEASLKIDLLKLVIESLQAKEDWVEVEKLSTEGIVFMANFEENKDQKVERAFFFHARGCARVKQDKYTLAGVDMWVGLELLKGITGMSTTRAQLHYNYAVICKEKFDLLEMEEHVKKGIEELKGIEGKDELKNKFEKLLEDSINIVSEQIVSFKRIIKQG